MLVNTLHYVYFEYNSGFTKTTLFYQLNKFRVFYKFFKNFGLLICQPYTVMFFFLLLIISLNSRIICAASSLFPTFSALSFNLLFSCRSPFIIDSKSSFFICYSDLLALMFVSGMFFRV